MHGGTLTATSEGKDKGSTFSIRLPTIAHCSTLTTSTQALASLSRFSVHGEQVTELQEEISLKQEPVNLPEERNQRRVLLIEDNKSTLLIMSRLLRQRLGYAVFMAASVRYQAAMLSVFL